MSNKWTSILEVKTSNEKADAYQAEMNEAMDKHFPIRTVRRRLNDEPWINDSIRRKEKAKKNLFKRVGRTDEWKKLNREVEELKRERKEKYLEEQKERLTGSDALKQFHKTVRNYKAAEKPTRFNVKELYPGLSEGEAAEELSLFFNRISD